ncbi:MAG: tol-pal system protein YbgF [Deltaproteobacteria bacterium]|nr:tol-pal system protein YbgF [Deltaproteobacteria bacterium]
MRRAFHSLALGLLAVVASGCFATRADLLKVQKDQREVRALLADTQVAVDGLRRKLDALKSQLEESNRGGGRGAARGGSKPTEELERRIAELEAKLAAQGQPGSLVAPPPVAGEQPDAAAVQPTPEPTKPATLADAALAKEEAAFEGAKVDDDYRDGIALVRAGQCDQATPKFRAFLKKNAKSDLADNAQYWVGECYYRQRNYNKAILELNDVLLRYPKGDKLPSALLTLASAFEDMGQKIEAKLVLQKLVSDHPKSEEAERGRQKLQALSD